ncbi:MAG: pitrilysin family protein [Planctomycetota bacterium]
MSVSVDASIQSITLSNGLTVLCQPMPWLRTASYTMWLPGGIAAEIPSGGACSAEQYDAEADPLAGLASLTCEMVQRGAGPYSSRDLVAAEDNLGIDASGSAATTQAVFSAAMPAESIADSLRLLAEIVRRPHLPQSQFDDAKMMLHQERMASLDEPTQRLMKQLRMTQYGNPIGRSGLASIASLESLTMDDVRSFYDNQYHAGGSFIAIAGNIDVSVIIEEVDSLFGDWKSGPSMPQQTPMPTDGNHHLTLESSQTHIGFAFDAIPYGHDDYFTMRSGIGILSDGMSSRLFDRVREQRGLCYSVWASTHSLPGFGSVFGYAGTTPPRAQETLDVTLHEIRHLGEGLSTDELDRWKTRIQSSLIMEQESAGSRAGSLASDQFQLGRVMTTDELERVIESITIDQVRDYWQTNAPDQFRIVTLGPEPLSTPPHQAPTHPLTQTP